MRRTRTSAWLSGRFYAASLAAQAPEHFLCFDEPARLDVFLGGDERAVEGCAILRIERQEGDLRALA